MALGWPLRLWPCPGSLGVPLPGPIWLHTGAVGGVCRGEAGWSWSGLGEPIGPAQHPGLDLVDHLWVEGLGLYCGLVCLAQRWSPLLCWHLKEGGWRVSLGTPSPCGVVPEGRGFSTMEHVWAPCWFLWAGFGGLPGPVCAEGGQVGILATRHTWST